MRRLLAVAAAITIAVALASPAEAGQPILVHGHLTVAGSSVSSGRVLVLLDGALVGWSPIGPGGRYAVPVAYSDAMGTRGQENNGYINFTLVAADGKEWSSVYAFSRIWSGGGWSRGTTPAVPDTLDLARWGVRSASRARNISAITLPNSGDSPYVCFNTVIGNTDAYTTIGETHTTSDMTEVLTYGKTADSDVGTGISYNQGNTWSLSGTVHIGTTKAAAVSWTRGPNYSHRESSQFHYTEYWVQGTGCNYYTIVATKWNGGAIDGSDVSTYDHHCKTTYNQWKVAFAPHTTFLRSTNNYVTFTLAATVFGWGGVTNQSGMSTWVQGSWSFSQGSGNRYLCGNDDFPTYASRIFAGT